MNKSVMLLTTRIALKPEFFNELLITNKKLNKTYKLYPGFKSSNVFIKNEQICRNPSQIGNLVRTSLQNYSILNISHWEDYQFAKNWLDCPQKFYIEKDDINKLYSEYMEIFENSENN